MNARECGHLIAYCFGKCVIVALNTVIVLLVAFLSWIAINIAVPMAEKAIYPPVTSFDITPLTCRGDDLIVRARLDKAEYYGGTYADFQGLTLKLVSLDNKDILWDDWHGETPTKPRNSVNRPAGTSTFDLILFDACETVFKAHTEHRSPLTWMRIKMKWGPFQGTPCPVAPSCLGPKDTISAR